MGTFMSKIEHFYKDIQGWFNFEDIYKDFVDNAQDGAICVEVGAWKGTSTAYMAVEIANSGKKIDFYTIDTWEGSFEHKDLFEGPEQLYQEFLKNMEPVKDYVKPIRKPSLEVANDFANESLDFVYIDASHEYHHVKLDLHAWYPKIKPGSKIAGHDYGWPGVEYATQEFARNNGLFVDTSKVSTTSSWSITKP